jgi:hypothetical protein
MHLVAPDLHRDAEHDSSPRPKERRIEMGGQRAHLALALVGLAAIASAVPLGEERPDSKMMATWSSLCRRL